MTQRFVTTSPDGSRDALYERRSAMSRDLLGDQQTEQTAGGLAKRALFGRSGTKERAATRRIRLPELTLGVVLVVGGAFVSTTLAKSRTQLVQVLGVARSVDKGEALMTRDLRPISLERSLASSFLPLNRADEVLGKVSLSALSAGSPIVEGMFANVPPLLENEAIIPLRLEIGDVPQGIAAGDSVRIAYVPDTNLSTEIAAQEFESVATVWSVQEPSDETPDFVVSMKAPRELLLVLTSAQKIKVSIITRVAGPQP